MKSLTGSLSTQRTEFVVLAPLGCTVPATFKSVEASDNRYSDLLGRMQRFRGSVYLYEGAIQSSQLTKDGRHVVPSDEQSWHILTVDQDSKIGSCIKFHEATPEMRYGDLTIARSAIARCPMWGETFRKAVEIERFNAQATEMRFGEAGGWAISNERRNTLESIRTALGTFGLLRLLGGGVGFSTATFKNGSATILQRLGLTKLLVEDRELPSYYDPYYSSEMEMLRFDSAKPSQKYASWVADIVAHLTTARVVFGERRVGAASKTGGNTVKYWSPLAGMQDPAARPLTV